MNRAKKIFNVRKFLNKFGHLSEILQQKNKPRAQGMWFDTTSSNISRHSGA